MGEGVLEYFETIGQLLPAVAVTDEDGKGIELGLGVLRALKLIREQSAQGGKLLFIGNGGSAAIASHQATDYWKNGGIRAIAFNDSSLLTCISNDYGYPMVFEKPIVMFADPGDVLVAISSSGQSENILRGVRAGKKKGCRILTLSGFDVGNPLRALGDLNFYVPSKTYGFVEITHLAILHAILDSLGPEG